MIDKQMKGPASWRGRTLAVCKSTIQETYIIYTQRLYTNTYKTFLPDLVGSGSPDLRPVLHCAIGSEL